MVLPLLLPAAPVFAHALVIGSDPAVDATLQAPPSYAMLRFNSRIDHERSRLTLIGPNGATQILAVGPATAPTMLRAAMPLSLPPGAWRLRWQVLAADGHITRGDVPFTISGPR